MERLQGHPNLIEFFESFTSKKGRRFNIVMEYADSGDLSQAIQDQFRSGEYFSEDEILNIFTQICLALKFCHDSKIIHRDIKPDNIFITKNGDVKLGDFGISRILSVTMSLAHTHCGTPFQMAPEMWAENPKYRYKVDIWALGALLYNLAALRIPFAAKSTSELINKIKNSDPDPIPDHYSPLLQTIIDQTLQKDPDDRISVNNILSIPEIKERAEIISKK